MRRRHILQAAGALVLGTGAARAKPAVEQLKIVHGFPAGGNADATARLWAEKLRGRFADNVIVESRTGAGGRIAAQAAKSAVPDGATLLLSPMSAMAIYPTVYKALGYDPQRDFAPVSLAATFALALAVGPTVPDWVVNVERLLAWMKTHPAQAVFGSPSAGTSPHFLGVQLSDLSGVKMQHVPYRGSVPGVADLIGGQIPLMITALGDFLPHAANGKIRLLATSEAQRSRFTPKVPTLAESGFPALAVVEWLGFFAPARTSSLVTAAASQALRAAAQGNDVREALGTFGLEPQTSTPEELAGRLRADLQRWAPVVRNSGFTADS